MSISSNSYFAQAFLAPILKRYLQLYPKMAVALVIEERIPDLYPRLVGIRQ
ncbi:hypothetical protein [Caedibacter taeniospiralis]|uniref:hypothetical protein n=1 Tax=Caedibacter taeniospiralis TaxID=28907 RepID=UPI0037BFC46B